eukprot:748788-Hanusia_phi.AAC.4
MSTPIDRSFSTRSINSFHATAECERASIDKVTADDMFASDTLACRLANGAVNVQQRRWVH